MKRNHVLVVLVGLLFVLIVVTTGRLTRAGDTIGFESATTTADVQNASPVVDATIRISTSAYGSNDFTTGIMPDVGATRTIHITGRVSDANGEADIATTSLAFYRTGVANGASCATDNNDCYRVAACSLNSAVGNDTEVDYDCPVGIAYWIDATDASGRFASDDWTVRVMTTDISQASSTATRSIEIESLLALNIPESIAYGTFSLGDQTTSGNNREMILTQKGNTYADVQLSGSNMGCSILGSIPVGNQKWSLLDVGYTAATGTLSGTPTPAERNITYRDSEVAELTASLYWNIGIPSLGVKGFCSGTNTVAVVAATSGGGGGGGNLGESWTIRSAVSASSWMSVTYGNGLFVAVAEDCPAYSGCVMTSPDGITWTAQDSASVNGWQDVTYGNGLFVAVAANDVHIANQQVMTSPDGVTWTGRATPQDRPWHSVAYGNSLFVAVAQDSGTGHIMTSPDGITWTDRSVPGNYWGDIAYSPDDGQFVAVSIGGTGTAAMTSPDGITWTLRTTPVGQWTGLAYGGGTYVAVASAASNNVITSPDGVTWTAHTSVSPDNFWNGIVYGNGMFVVVAYGDPLSSSVNRVMTSQ